MKRDFLPSLLFLLVLFTGVFLRAYDWMAIPFTHDEFSALFRTGFSDFYTLIQEGVAKSDVHPAGVQVFLNYWVALLGDSPPIVKLPFLICGLGTIYLTYRIGAYWFHHTAGLVASALVASMQPMVMYSQIARPYMSGTFFVLLAVWFLSQYVNRSDKALGAFIGWILAAIGAAYNHYFSLLTIAVIGILGLGLITREKLPAYGLSGFLITIGFAPHIPVTLAHLGKEGLNWLGEPDLTFFLDFFRYMTHYSGFIFVLWGLLLITGSVYHFRYRDEPNDIRKRFRYLLLGAFLLPALVGFTYSISVEPVLQFSSLMFALPLLVIAGTSLLPSLATFFQGILVVFLLTINVYTLIAERQHYDVFYNNRYSKTKRILEKDIKQYGAENVLTFVSVKEKLKDWWYDQSATIAQAGLNRPSTITPDAFREKLKQTDKSYLVFANPEQISWKKLWLANQYYPYALKIKNFHLGRYYLMAKEPHPDTVKLFSKTVKMGQSQPSGTMDSTFPSGEKFGPNLKTPLSPLLINPNDVILASAKIKYMNLASNAELALSLKQEEVDKPIIWRSSRPMFPEDTTWRPTVVAIRLAGKPYDLNALKADLGVWDPDEGGFKVKDLNLHVIQGNPFYYCLRRPIAKPYQ